MTFKPIGDAASNVVKFLKKDDEDLSPQYSELCEAFSSIVDDAVEEKVAPWEVMTALLLALSHLISHVDPEVDEEIELSLFRSIPQLFKWAARVREEEGE